MDNTVVAAGGSYETGGRRLAHFDFKKRWRGGGFKTPSIFITCFTRIGSKTLKISDGDPAPFF